MLNKEFDKLDCCHFHPWMFQYMTTILIGKQYYDWSQILLDNIHNQLVNVRKTKKLFFTSYVIWVAAQAGQFPRLQTKGKLEEGEKQKRVWEYYTQLPLSQAKLHFKRVNDAFLFQVFIKLIGDVGYRINQEDMAIIKQQSTYIRVSGFKENPMLLPKYCSNRLILLEYFSQMVKLQSLLSSKHKIGVDFSVTIGYFSCSKIQVANTTEPQLQDLQLKEFDYAREFYDPNGKLKLMMPKAYEGHKPELEDFQANLQDSFEFREKSYYQVTVPKIRDFEIDTNLPKELRDDGELLYPL